MMKAHMICYYPDQAADVTTCYINFDGQKVTLSYKYDDEVVHWSGSEERAGHFSLHSQEVDGFATMHRSTDDSLTLSGAWVEKDDDGHDYRGMWRIELPD